MNNEQLETILRSNYKRTKVLALVSSIVALVMLGVFAVMVYNNPSKIAFSLAAFLVIVVALGYRYALYLPAKRENGRLARKRR